MSEQPQATVREIDGQLVLVDPVAVSVITAVEKQNCRKTMEAQIDRVEHFKRRMTELKKSPNDVVIVLLNVDDIHGGPVAEHLMPNTDWQPFRDNGEIPFARGLADRKGICEIVCSIDKQAGEELNGIFEPAVVVMDHGVVGVFPA